MKKGWRVILGIVLAALVFGGLCCGVGFLTGADYDRIILNLDEHYQLMTYVDACTAWVKQLPEMIATLF